MNTSEARWRLSPPRFVLVSFAGLILIGACLLMLPISTWKGALSPIDALFTATTAVCVTGLVTVDLGTTFTLFGRFVIMLLVQVGGLGFATFSTFAALLVGRRIGLRERIVLREAFNQNDLQGLVRLAKLILAITFLIEGAGAVLLTIGLLPQYRLVEALGHGIFLAVSAFNNAGLDLFGGFRSLQGQPAWIDAILCCLIVLGGLGFVVIGEIVRSRRVRNWSLHARVVVVTTVALLAGGAALAWVSEYTSPTAFAHANWIEQGAQALFISVTSRTAGFATFDYGTLGAATLMIIMLLMFIGASPGSTGGGIKTTTFATLGLSVWATVRGRREPMVFERRFPMELIFRVVAITILSGLWVIAATMALTLLEPKIDFIRLLFEVVSAFGTVGLTTGITPHLDTAAKWVLILTMFAGRVGTLTFFMALTSHEASPVRYPEGNLHVG